MIHWNPDPNLIAVGPITIRWYGLMFVTGFAIAFQLMRRMFIREGKPVEPLDALLIYVVIGTTVGARLGHCLFYEPGYFFAHPLEILQIWKGGLASHGGTLGVIIALYLFSRKYTVYPFVWLLDRLSIPTAIVAGLIRIGNVMNSEIIGKPSDLPWAFIFERVDHVPRHPAQLYESFTYFCLFAITWTLYRRNPKRPHGFFFGIMLIWIFGWRIVWEFFKENQSAFENAMTFNMGQLLSVPFILVGLFLLIRAIRIGSTQPETAVSGKKKKRS